MAIFSKTRASAYDNLTYLLQEIVWLQSAKKEIPEQVEEFFERINTNKVRVEVKEEDRWNLESMYQSIEDWENDYQKVLSLEEELLKYKNHLLPLY